MHQEKEDQGRRGSEMGREEKRERKKESLTSSGRTQALGQVRED